jgi:hypothetical protein
VVGTGSEARRAYVATAGAAFIAVEAVAAANVGIRDGHPGVVAVAAAAVVLLLATLTPTADRDGVYAEAVAIIGAVMGLALTRRHDIDRAFALTVLVPGLAAPGARADRRWYLVASAAIAVVATWAWFEAADVRLLEAYTLPAAAGALAGGLVHHRMRPSTRSWVTYGPAIAIALGPSLVVVVTETALVRPIALGAGAVALCWAGAHLRLQAPLVLGAAALLVIAVDTLAPVTAAIPRWLTVGLAGALLVWLGATADRRLAQLRRTRDRLAAFEHEPAH